MTTIVPYLPFGFAPFIYLNEHQKYQADQYSEIHLPVSHLQVFSIALSRLWQTP
jgi:hypothetical protein